MVCEVCHGLDEGNCHHRSHMTLCSPFSRPRIPIELQEMAICLLAPRGEWPDAATLANSALVCRVWYRMVTNLLYAQIQVFCPQYVQSLLKSHK